MPEAPESEARPSSISHYRELEAASGTLGPDSARPVRVRGRWWRVVEVTLLDPGATFGGQVDDHVPRMVAPAHGRMVGADVGPWCRRGVDAGDGVGLGGASNSVWAVASAGTGGAGGAGGAGGGGGASNTLPVAGACTGCCRRGGGGASSMAVAGAGARRRVRGGYRLVSLATFGCSLGCGVGRPGHGGIVEIVVDRVLARLFDGLGGDRCGGGDGGPGVGDQVVVDQARPTVVATTPRCGGWSTTSSRRPRVSLVELEGGSGLGRGIGEDAVALGLGVGSDLVGGGVGVRRRTAQHAFGVTTGGVGFTSAWAVR